nr:MAG TPA: hypothetical protein [Caudoviricetes sp.]
MAYIGGSDNIAKIATLLCRKKKEDYGTKDIQSE